MIPRGRMSSLNRISRLQAMCVCAFLTTSCTYPSVLGRGDRSAAVEHSAASPRFSQGGPDAEEYGASEGYPVGDRGTCSRPVFLVGCLSHLDQVYEARLVRRATMASPLARAAVEPTIRYDSKAKHLLLTTTSRATRPPDSLSPVVTRS